MQCNILTTAILVQFSIVCYRHFLATILGYDTHAHSAALKYLVHLSTVTIFILILVMPMARLSICSRTKKNHFRDCRLQKH
jgi:hypothetical protein